MSALVWTIKRSFLDYVRDRAGGRIEVAGGAGIAADGAIAFPAKQDVAQLSRAGQTLRLDFSGEVRLTGHGGLLELPLRALRLESDGPGGYAVTIEDPDAPDERLAFVTIAAFTPVAGGWQGKDTALTYEGAKLFFGPYEVGTEFDDPVVTA